MKKIPCRSKKYYCNVLDKEILEFGKLKEAQFNKEIQNFYSEKNSRIRILGEDQNNNLEKKYFYRLLIFHGDHICNT